MGMGWYLYEFDGAAFDAVFGGDDADGREILMAALADPHWFDLPDLDQARQVIETVGQHGIRYEGLSEDEIDVLDCSITAAIKTPQLAEKLSVIPLTRVPFDPELVRAIKAACQFPAARQVYQAIWEGGRRAGQTNVTWCNYLLLTPGEVDAVLADAGQFVAHASEADEFAALIQESLIESLQRRSSPEMYVACFGS